MTLGVLGSYWLDRGERFISTLHDAGVPIVWDSGAFSVAMGNATIDVDDHTAWVIEQSADAPAMTRFVGLDVIGDADATIANYTRQRADGAYVEPTLHYGTHPDRIADYLDHGDFDWFNVGGLVPVLGNKSLRRNIAAFIAACRRRLPPEVKIHALGCFHPDVIRLCRVDGADSTYWLTLPRWRSLSLFNTDRGDWYRFTVCTTSTKYDDRRRATWRTAYKRGRWLRDEYGLTPEDLTVDPDDEKLLRAGIEAHHRLSEWATALHGSDMVVYLAGGIDTRVAVDALVNPDRHDQGVSA